MGHKIPENIKTNQKKSVNYSPTISLCYLGVELDLSIPTGYET